MQTITESFNLLWEALFLQPQPYAAMRDQKNPAGKGLVILIILGLALALAAFIGAILGWASSPDLMAIKDTVLRGMQQMSWWDMMAVNEQAEALWFQIWDSVWQVVSFLNPTPASGLMGFITTPLSLIISWFFFGVVAHLIARLFGGQAGFSQTLGVTALAAAPQMLGFFKILPLVVLAGVRVWTLLARYLAIRVTHDLSWGRALWVTILTMVVVWLLLGLLAGAGVVVFGSTMAASMGGG